MRIGIAQMNSRDNKADNLSTAETLIDHLAARGAKLIVFPEHFNFLGSENQKVEQSETLEDSMSLKTIRHKAVNHGVHIHCGSFLERDGEHIYNTGVVFDPVGEMVVKYRKIHLFDVEVPGGRKYLESEIITPGEDIVTFTIGAITFGMATCYDLRFPELFRELSARGAQVILLPAAFTLQTGRDHWELLLRARAVENLCYMVGAGQYGNSPPNHQSYGRSMVVDPWGVVISQAGDGIRAITADIDLPRLQEIRQGFPALQHRRRDLFR